VHFNILVCMLREAAPYDQYKVLFDEVCIQCICSVKQLTLTIMMCKNDNFIIVAKTIEISVY